MIHHFTTELGQRSAGGVGTFLNEYRRICGPCHRFVCLGPSHPEEPPEQHTIFAGFYDMDILNRLKFDIAVFHYYGLAYLADASFLRGRRLVFVVHSVPTVEPWSLLDPYGGHSDIARSFEKLCDAADLLVCVSKSERGKLLLLYPDLQPKTRVIPNGFSAFRDLPVSVRPNRRTFGFLGRADERKGLRELVHAFSEVDGALQIACGAEDPEYIRSIREDIAGMPGLADRILWTGRISAANKLAFLRGLDALIVPSHWEPFGYVALEALRAGIPPIISSRGGLLEIVGQPYRYTFDPYDPESIATSIALFQNDTEETIRESVKQAREHAAALTAEHMVRSYDELLFGVTAPVLNPSDVLPRRRYARVGNLGLEAPVPGHASNTPKKR